MKRRGVILAGGRGSRLFPLTRVTSKQLLPIFDKPMIYYPLTTLMLAGVTDYVLISTPSDLPRFEALLGSGRDWGLSIHYREQPHPKGIADALLVAEDFIDGHPSALILGDNFFFGNGLFDVLARANERSSSTIFAYQVSDPERYGIVVVDGNDVPQALYEKPRFSASHWAVTGLYFYGPEVISVAKGLKPSRRGEREITDVNRELLAQGKLSLELLHRGFAWLDTGTHESLHEASSFVQTVQSRQGLLVASPEEVAYRMGFIDENQLTALATQGPESTYGNYLRQLAQRERR